MINLFSGGALLKLSVFALGIMPYITASIILQLLSAIIPRLETLKKDGQAGQAKITQYTRYLTIAIAIMQSTAILSMARSPGSLLNGCTEILIPNQSLPVLLTMILVMTAGTAVIMWLGETITERGVGNGMSLLIFTSIIATIPAQFASIWGSKGPLLFLATLAIGVMIVISVVFVEQAQRRIPVQYAKRVVGRHTYDGGSTYIPLKVNMAGVIPVIFASSLLFLPNMVAQFTGSTSGWALWVQQNLSMGTGGWFMSMYFLMIVFFCYFYVSITFNPVDVADDMKKYGGFIPGIRAGRPTAEYLDYVLTRLTAPGSLYLGIIAILPVFAFEMLGVSSRFIFGGTSLLIMVGVGLDTIKQVDSQLQQHNYEGLLT
jgi:preprotein translocase subunit SecY